MVVLAWQPTSLYSAINAMKLRLLFNHVVPPLRKWERQLLDEVGRGLPASLAAAFTEQVREINYVQRLQEGKEINFYRMRGPQANVSSAPRIPTPSEEYLLARVRIEPPGKTSLTCQLWVVCGIVFSITCNEPPRKIDESARIRVINLYLPTTEAKQRNPLLDSINADLRSEYEMLVVAGRMFGAGVSLLEPNKLRQLSNNGGDYCVLGESADAELLLARCDKSQRGLFFLNVEDGEQRPAANSLAELFNG